jgi:CRISPR-associated protein (TIGR02584 family)
MRNRILIALAGLSPQLVTETVFGLAVAAVPRWIPDEIHLITTREGAERARLTLFGPGNWFGRLCREYDLNGISFSEHQIHIVDREGQLLEDIRNTQENRAAADFIVQLMRRFTRDPESEIALSIAGGRKTMGFFAGAALSLFGRSQDRLLHVLVSPGGFESHPGFFYPTKGPQIIYSLGNNSRPMDCSMAEITVAELPFVRLREWIPQTALESPASWSETVAATQQRLGPPTLKLFPRTCRVFAVGQKVWMQRASFAFYLWLARRAAAGKAFLPSPDGASAVVYTDEYRKAYFAAGGASTSRTIAALEKEPMTADFFVERRSRVNSALQRALGWRAGPFLIQSCGKRPNTGYGIDLPRDAVVIAAGED